MDQKWIRVERELWDDMMNPCPAAVRWLAWARRRHRQMPPGKARAKLHEQITKTEARVFAAGWQAYSAWAGH